MIVRLPAIALAAALCASAACAQTAEPFKIAFIDPLSGPFSNVGELMRNHVLFAVDDVNAKGGIRTDAVCSAQQLDLPTECQMKRP